MCYQLPGDITKDGKPIVGGLDIDASDFAFAASIYAKIKAAPRQKSRQGREPLARMAEPNDRYPRPSSRPLTVYAFDPSPAGNSTTT